MSHQVERQFMNQIVRTSEFGPWHPDLRGSYHYFISGFRSLQNFEITIKPGLNVLLGTNGSGKTNFIDFLDFITVLVNNGAPAAISSAGGIARVFSQESLKRKIPRIRMKVCGLADLEPHIIGSISIDRKYFNFEYELDLRYSKYFSTVYIAGERLKFKNLHSNENLYGQNKTVGSIEMHRKGPLLDDEIKWKVGNYLTSNAPRNPLRFVHRHRAPSRRAKESVSEFREAVLREPPSVGPDESLLSSRMAFPAVDAVREAMSRSQSFNLNPSVAREPDDISRPPFIDPNGKGLYSTIFHMQKLASGSSRQVYARRRFPKDALETILAWSQIVLPDLTAITATADPHTGKYLVYLHVECEPSSLKIPLQNASDGTLKWLAYVSLVVSQGSEYTFEEPENYLHPKMQQFFVSLIRDYISSSDELSRFIVSTHSETLINQCSPDELILFKFDAGETTSSRVKNTESLINQVNETGFGLGYYYTNNVVR